MASDFSRRLTDGRAGFPDVLDALEAHLDGCGVPAAVIASVMIAADDVISNVLDHGGQGAGPPQVEVSVKLVEGQVAVWIVDDGAAFNPLDTAAPDTALALEDRAIGGLGVHLVRKLMDTASYERREGHNRLRFSKRYASPASNT